ncbi:hypothetical protein KKH39_01900 [Patescibacteria group bacterium]|nr:hypothetical protein [Patescibacteria group bacterium]
MKKIILTTIIILFSGIFYVKAGQSAGFSDLLPRLRGYILLQVQENGEAWYVNPTEDARIYMKNGTVAYSVMANLGLGISNDDLAKIPVGLEKRFECIDNDGDGLCNKLEEGLETDFNDNDSDNDGYDDGTEILNNYNPLGLGRLNYDYALANRLKGRIVLQVQKRGQAWYINPNDGKRYYLRDGEAAYQIMRFLSLGISNSDLARIPVSSFDIIDNVITPPDSGNGSDNPAENSGDDSSDNSNDGGEVILPQCGNGIIESGEECDGSAPSGYTCNLFCKLVVDDSESGDDGGGNVTNPVQPQCGNGIIESGEQCDGSAPSGYTCTNQCLLERVPDDPQAIYSSSILNPYKDSIIVAQSDVPEGSAYQWKINGQSVEGGFSPTIFLAHYDGNTNTVNNEQAVANQNITYSDTSFGQGMSGRVEYLNASNININEGTLDIWLTMKENISSSVFDSDPFILSYKNLQNNDALYLLVHSNDLINFTLYDGDRGWPNAAQTGTGKFELAANKPFMMSATWSVTEQSVKFYLNGEQIARRDYEGDFPNMVMGTENFKIGNPNVIIDEIRILNKPLSADEIRENYKRAAPFSNNDILYSGNINQGDTVSAIFNTNEGQISSQANILSNKINIVSPDGYFVRYTNSLGVQFNTISNMTCRYGSTPDLYDQLPYSAGSGTFHSINIAVADPIEPVPVAIKCRSVSGQGDDYGFFRQYRILPEQNNNYPKISRLWWENAPSQDEVDFLSKFDMVSFSKASFLVPSVVRNIKAINPQIVLLLYKDAIGHQDYGGVAYETFADRLDPSLRLQSSENIGTYCYSPSFPYSILYNIYNGSNYNTIVAEHMEKDIFDRLNYFDGIWWDVVGTSFWFLYDYVRDPGIFEQYCDFDFDGIDEDINNTIDSAKARQIWTDGMHDQMQKTRAALGQNILTVGNGSSPNHSDYNGNLWEETFNYGTFSNYFNPSYIHSFLYWQEHSLTPRLNDNLFANNYFPGSAPFYKYHRFGMTSSIIAGVYYNPQPLNSNRNTWWFDEYWVNPKTAFSTDNMSVGKGYLGEPIGPAYVDNNLVWRRNFENGIVIVNNTNTSKNVDLFGQFRQINGSQDPTINAGQTIETLDLADYDGRILLRPLCSDNPYEDPWCMPDSGRSIDEPPILSP